MHALVGGQKTKERMPRAAILDEWIDAMVIMQKQILIKITLTN